jgi:hypothetical protein
MYFAVHFEVHLSFGSMMAMKTKVKTYCGLTALDICVCVSDKGQSTNKFRFTDLFHDMY